MSAAMTIGRLCVMTEELYTCLYASTKCGLLISVYQAPKRLCHLSRRLPVPLLKNCSNATPLVVVRLLSEVFKEFDGTN